MKIAPLVLAAAICGLAASANAATVVGATQVHVTNALGDYLQVGELVALDFSGVDVAFAGMGGTASAPDQYSAESQPGNAIDGALPYARSYYATPGIYHSAGTSGFLDVFFAAPANLSSLSIYGRTDCCSERDVYNVNILNAAGMSLYFGTISAANAAHVGTVTFDSVGTAVPEPATWALMIGGLGTAGAMLRRRRSATAIAA